MSLALSKAAALKAEIRLAEAVSLFEADLSPEQKAAFAASRLRSRGSPPTIHDVMRLTAEIDRVASVKLGGRRCFGPRLTSLLQAVQQFAALGDIILGSSQNIIASSVWVLVRMTLLSLVNFSSCLEKMSTLFMTVGRSAPRYEKMALLYPRSEALQSHLSEYFIVIIRLCHRLLGLTKKSIWGQVLSLPNDPDVQDCASELERWACSIKDEVNLLMCQSMEEQNSRLKSLLRHSEAESHRRRLERYARVLDSCSQYDHQTTWKQVRKLGSATVFHQATEYQNWKTQLDSCTLLYKGMLGSGKSVLLANIVDDLNLHVQDSGVPVAYFFCCHDISESLKARTVIGSLARQLLSLSSSKLTGVGDLIDKTPSDLDLKGIISLLRRALPRGFRAYCVVDGLDECDDSEMSTLIHRLKNLQDSFPLLICVSSRTGPDNVLRFNPERFARTCSITMPDDNPDIASFITAELERSIESRSLVIGDPRLILEIRDVLLQGAQGMFLWVTLQIGSLCTEKTDEAIRKALEDLPKDLSGTFSRILGRCNGLGGKYHQTRIFELVAVAHRPLTIEELREALSVVPGDVVWNPARLLNDAYSALACCGSLLTVDEEVSAVRLVHHSVMQFLLDDWSLKIERAEKSMEDIIVTYLNYNVFDTQVSTAMAPHVAAQDAPSRIIRSMDAGTVRSLALRLLRSRRLPECDVGKVLWETRGQSRRPLSLHQFQFYSYANAHWLRHMGHISQTDPVLYRLQLQVFERQPMDATNYAEWKKSLFQAVEMGRENVVKLILEKGMDIESKEPTMRMTPLLWAVRAGQDTIVKLLLDKGAIVDATDHDGRVPLIWAAIEEHRTIVRLLLDNGANIEATSHGGRTPLIWAAKEGHKRIVELLLEMGANPMTRDHIGVSASTWAAVEGHKSIADLLVDKCNQFRRNTLEFADKFSVGLTI
ncbi:NACHT domain-containing protein [Madurella fahalii]|uniref:NACHT domain-containing protein n=1 Tax=Madurella fahalii TaxID=1157608 RepID=A0ABQ0GMC5_9PEZI